MFHCLNRGNDRNEIFAKDGDYAAFEKAMAEVLKLAPMRLLAYCLMPNHWHLLLWPREDGDPFDFAQGRSGPVHAPADRDARAPMARAPPQHRARARLSRHL